MVRVFKSAPITKRYDFSTLETADGVCVVVSGLINKLRTTESGFSLEVCESLAIFLPLKVLSVSIYVTSLSEQQPLFSGLIKL